MKALQPTQYILSNKLLKTKVFEKKIPKTPDPGKFTEQNHTNFFKSLKNHEKNHDKIKLGRNNNYKTI